MAAIGAVSVWATNATAAAAALESLTVWQLLAVQFGSAVVVVLGWRAALVFGSSAAVHRRWRAMTALRTGAGSSVKAPGVVLGRWRLATGNGPRHRGARDLAVALAVGVPGLTGTVLLQYWAFATAPIVGANVIAYGWPLLAAAWVAVTVRSRHAVRGVVLAVVGFAGMLAIMTDHHGGAGDLTGYLVALGSAAGMAFYTLAAARVSALTVTDLLVPATSVGFAIAVTASALHGMPWPDIAEWLPAAYVGVGPMAAGYGLWTYAMGGGRAKQLAPLGFATPLLSTLLLVATGQPATVATVIGGVLILVCSAGVLVAGLPAGGPSRCDAETSSRRCR